MGDDPTVSIVIEWENVILCDDQRCFAMLRRLGEELRRDTRRSEVIVLFDPRRVARSTIQTALERHVQRPEAATTEFHIEPCPGKHYYQLKNEGARRARGRIVVFLDSDVIPETGWLDAILKPFETRRADIVAGTTYLAHETFVDKAFALGWFFPLRSAEDRVHPWNRHFFANNVAFRRTLLLEHPFPEQPQGVTRGACQMLARALRQADIPIWTATAARAEHPPPSDAGHIVCRALAHGRDDVFRVRQERGRGPIGALLGACLRWPILTLLAIANICRRHRRVGLATHRVPPAIGMMGGFYALRFIGSVVAVVAPAYSRRRWQI